MLLDAPASEPPAGRALLAELIDELRLMPSQHVAVRAARSLQRSLEDSRVEQDSYEKRILRIADLARVRAFARATDKASG